METSFKIQGAILFLAFLAYFIKKRLTYRKQANILKFRRYHRQEWLRKRGRKK